MTSEPEPESYWRKHFHWRHCSELCRPLSHICDEESPLAAYVGVITSVLPTGSHGGTARPAQLCQSLSPTSSLTDVILRERQLFSVSL